MFPAVILYTVALAGPLDAPDYRTRERARADLERLAPVEAWPGVYALSRHRSPEVASAASTYAGRWHEMWASAEADRLVWRAIHAPFAEKPWRELNEFEQRQWPWREWAVPFWRTKVAAPLATAYPGHETVFDEPIEPGNLCRGMVAGTIWHMRVIVEKNNGVYRQTHASEW